MNRTRDIQGGYTLIQLIIVLLIIAVVAGYFSFRFSGFLDTIKLRSATRAIASDLRACEVTALTQQKEVRIVFGADRYIKDGKTRRLPSSIKVLNPQTVMFGKSGMPVPGHFGTIRVVVNNKGASIVISPAGRIRIE